MGAVAGRADCTAGCQGMRASPRGCSWVTKVQLTLIGVEGQAVGAVAGRADCAAVKGMEGTN